MEQSNVIGFIIQIWVIVFGLTVGSFLNVCIYRIPKKISLVWPGSACVSCDTKIAWYDNVPVFSYLLLKGRCRKCGSKISIRYPIVEIITGITFWLLFNNIFILNGGPLYVCGFYIVFCCFLIISSFVDLELHIIPNEIVYIGLIMAPIVSLLFPALHDINGSLKYSFVFGNLRASSFLMSLIGILVTGGMIYLCGVIGKIIFKKDAMGFGDVKLMGVIGGFMGWKLGVTTFFLAPFFGLLFGIPKLVLKRESVIPYGPFLSLAAFVCFLFRDYFNRIIDIYLNTFVFLFTYSS